MKTYLTKRLTLRQLQLKDYKTWLRSQEICLPKQNKYDLAPNAKSKQSFAVFKKNVKRHSVKAKKDQAYIWNIFLRKTGELIGWIDVSTICRDPYQMANLGYFIINIYRRQGYAKEAVQRIIKAAFSDLKYHRLEAATDLENHPSKALAKACGLKKEGVKKHYWFQNNQWEDQMVFIVTPELLK